MQNYSWHFTLYSRVIWDIGKIIRHKSVKSKIRQTASMKLFNKRKIWLHTRIPRGVRFTLYQLLIVFIQITYVWATFFLNCPQIMSKKSNKTTIKAFAYKCTHRHTRTHTQFSLDHKLVYPILYAFDFHFQEKTYSCDRWQSLISGHEARINFCHPYIHTSE